MKHPSWFQPCVSIITALSIVTSGCTSTPTATAPIAARPDSSAPEVMDWARKEVERRNRVLTEAQNTVLNQAEQIRQLVAENARLKSELQIAEKAKAQAEAVAWIANNKTSIAQEFTKKYKPISQTILETYGFTGTALDYEVDEVLLREGVLYFSQLILWRKPDQSGAIARVTVGQEISSDKFVYQKTDEVKDLSYAELRSILGTQTRVETSKLSPPPPQDPSIWKPSNQTVNAGYAAAIGLVATALGAWIKHAIETAGSAAK